jgi:hypothetical protein
MEKEIVLTTIAQNDFWKVVSYLKEQWPEKVLDNFHKTKSKLLQSQPQIGFKSSKYSRLEKH